MARTIKPATWDQAANVEMALADLRSARARLKAADCPQAARKVRSALKSADGALRHVRHRLQRSKP